MKIGIQPLLPIGNFLNKRYSIEMDFPDDSHPPDNFKYLNEIITAIHMSEYPLCYKDGKPLFSNYQGEEATVAEVQVDKPADKIDGWIQVIELASTVTALEKFKPTVDKANDQRLTDAYNKQMKKIRG